jgi:small conductance mechanosensitive channel
LLLPFATAAEAVLLWLRGHGVRIALVLVLAAVVSRTGALAVRRVRRRLEGSPTQTIAANIQRAATLTSTMAYAVRVVVWTFAVLMVLGELGLNLAPLLAGASIAGVALGFGAQSVVRDFLAGFFLLMEDQFGVGDVVELAIGSGTEPIAGRVENLTLRSTAVRAKDGTIAIAGNGSILTVQNKSRGRGQVTVDVTVPGSHHILDVERRLDEVVDELRQDRDLQRVVSSGPDPLAVEPTTGGEMVVSIAAETRPARRQEVEDQLRRRLRRRMIPFPQQAGSDDDRERQGL